MLTIRQFFGGKSALLTYSPAAPTLMTPSAGYTFSWRNGVSGGNGLDIGVKNWYSEDRDADRVEGQIAFDNKIVATDLGYFFNSVVS